MVKETLWTADKPQSVVGSRRWSEPGSFVRIGRCCTEAPKELASVQRVGFGGLGAVRCFWARWGEVGVDSNSFKENRLTVKGGAINALGNWRLSEHCDTRNGS